MAERHLYTYETSPETKTGAEYIQGVQWLWTDGHSSIWSRALSLINGGQGVAPYAAGSWTKTETFLWGGGGGWNLKWTSDDGLTTVESVENEPTYSKTDWVTNSSVKISSANGDSFDFNSDYESHHKLLPDGTTYIGGNYAGGHSIDFTSTTETAKEENAWQSTVNYDKNGTRFENIKNPKFNLNFENDKYILKWNLSLEQNWGILSQVNPAHVRKDASGLWVVKNLSIKQGGDYYFKDKSTGYEFYDQVGSGGTYIDNEKNTATVKFKDVRQVKDGVVWETPELTLNMTAEEYWGINWGSDIGSDLGGVEGAISNLVAPFTEFLQAEALKKNNKATISDLEGAEVNADAGNDTVTGAVGNDTIDGGQGNDSVVAGAGADEIDGGDGADKVAGGDGEDEINGGSGTDTIDGGTGDDVLLGGAGNDSVVAGAGADEIDGGDGADRLAGGEGADDLTGGIGNDSLDGGTGDDVLYSGDGNDNVSGGDGADKIVGGDGAGNDSYDGGKGIDTVTYTSAKAGIRIDLAKGTAGSITAGDAAGIGSDKLKGIENIISGDFADIITGSKEANSIMGGNGSDTINGGLGKDTLAGGLGADVFVFNTKPAGNNIDTLGDFQSGEDKIQLSLKTFAKLKGASDYLVTGAPTKTTQYLIYDSATGQLSYDADGSATKVKPVEIALIGTGLTLTSADFIVA